MTDDRAIARVIPVSGLAAQPGQPGLNRGARTPLLIALLFWGLTAVGIVRPLHAAEQTEVQTAQGMTVYIGVIPAAMIKGHPEVMMHGGKPSGADEFHLTVAVFDATSGRRISDVTVTANVAEVGLAGTTTALKPMNIANTMTYGGFVVMRPMARYDLRIVVARPKREPATFVFAYTRPHQ